MGKVSKLSEKGFRGTLEKKLLGEAKSITPKKKKNSLKTKRGLSVREVWKLRKRLQRLVPIKTPQKAGVKGNLQRHHKDGDITNNKKGNVLIVSEKQHVEIHRKAGTYHVNAKGVK